MRRFLPKLLLVFLAIVALDPTELLAARRRAAHRTTIVVRHGFPLRRALPRAVVVRPARRVVVIESPVVFLAPVVWGAAVVALPARERLVWEDSEVIYRDEDWVDIDFGVDDAGTALFLELDGRAQLSFAEVVFGTGKAQAVDFRDWTRGSGVYQLLDFPDGRLVKKVRVVARAKTAEARLKVYMQK